MIQKIGFSKDEAAQLGIVQDLKLLADTINELIDEVERLGQEVFKLTGNPPPK